MSLTPCVKPAASPTVVRLPADKMSMINKLRSLVPATCRTRDKASLVKQLARCNTRVLGDDGTDLTRLYGAVLSGIPCVDAI
jgi:hypothetical protein